jgi:2-keto-4-pentenoate hydratase/2-oxohepta-3-ene-1,7-dioic acid hydratase in catechol pathway
MAEEASQLRFVSFTTDGVYRLGIEKNGSVLNISPRWAAENDFPLTMEELVHRGFEGVEYAKSLEDWLLADHTEAGTWLEENEVQFAPAAIHGRKIVCVGLNYLKHAHESHMDVPKVPLLFSKFDNTLVGHNATVIRPLQTNQLDYEAEIAVVIGKTVKDVSEEEALDYVLGYTLANDLSARDMQFVTSQWLLGKTYDGFCPIGPALVTRDEVPDPGNIRIRCLVNGEVRQDANTRQMIFSVATLISYISSHFTLRPGDVILSGTPDGVALGMPEGEQKWLQPGDVVVVEADGLGKLRTFIG